MLLGSGKKARQHLLYVTQVDGKKKNKVYSIKYGVSLFIKKSPFYHIFTEIIHLFIRFMYFAFLQTEQNGKRM